MNCKGYKVIVALVVLEIKSNPSSFQWFGGGGLKSLTGTEAASAHLMKTWFGNILLGL